mmetsp:Transcript_1553/g.2777  ORF Transcript_1553/g.2777 Transcript_1553/m.2777 type:complete len:340 (-) Transcript_1553:32-1051(-)
MANNLWIAGVVLAVLASMTGTAGKQLFRLSELEKLKEGTTHLCMSKAIFAAGLALNVAVGPLIDMGSYAFAPQSLIAPLGALDVVWNTATAPCTLGEKLDALRIVGCMMIGTGAVVTSIVGSHDEKEMTIENIQDFLFRWPVFVYLLCLTVWLALNIALLIPRSAAPKGEPWVTGDPVRGLSLGMTAGSIAGNMFCVKAFVELVQSSIEQNSAENFKHWLPYFIFAGALFFAISNLYFLTKAMREYEALFMGAVFEGSLIFAASVSGCVIFAELDGLPWWKVFLYWLALGGIVGGIYTTAAGALHSKKEHSQVTPDDDTAKPEDTENWASPVPMKISDP